jgi:hypothetical protein
MTPPVRSHLTFAQRVRQVMLDHSCGYCEACRILGRHGAAKVRAGRAAKERAKTRSEHLWWRTGPEWSEPDGRK